MNALQSSAGRLLDEGVISEDFHQGSTRGWSFQMGPKMRGFGNPWCGVVTQECPSVPWPM
uniref:Uncharacterized protein n=1 Tax=Anguilla anguilla TaxID=7936 RepID=A0A0E9PQ14_ANGAN